MLKIAITGNIASGKTEVEKILKEKYPVYDTDEIAHKCLDTITEFYGYDVFTEGKIDRKKLGKLVFDDVDLKKKLEEIVHPMVKKEVLNIFENHKNDFCVFISVPLLFETDFHTLFDKIIFISADKNIRLKRLMKRNNFNEEEAYKRIEAQIAEEDKLSRADFIIDNSTTIENLKVQINKILTNIC